MNYFRITFALLLGSLLWRVEAAYVHSQDERSQAQAELLKTHREMLITTDVKALYENSFPAEERQPLEDIQLLINRGRILLHTSRDAKNILNAFSFVSLHDETDYKFAHLDYIATDKTLRSKGVGSLHLKNLNAIIQITYPHFVAMTLEMEDPKEVNLDIQEKAHRVYRSQFYERLGACNTLPGHYDDQKNYVTGFKILDFKKIEDPETWTPEADNQPAEWRAFVYKSELYNPLLSAIIFYSDAGGYGLPITHPAVDELLRLHGHDREWLKKTVQ